MTLALAIGVLILAAFNIWQGIELDRMRARLDEIGAPTPASEGTNGLEVRHV